MLAGLGLLRGWDVAGIRNRKRRRAPSRSLGGAPTCKASVKTMIGLCARSTSVCLIPIVALCVSQSCYAMLTFYSDRTAFALANSGLSTEDFEEGVVLENFARPSTVRATTTPSIPVTFSLVSTFSNSDPVGLMINDLILVDSTSVTPLRSKALSKALDSLGVAFGSGLDIAFAGDGSSRCRTRRVPGRHHRKSGHRRNEGLDIRLRRHARHGDAVHVRLGPVFFGVSSDLGPIKRINVDGMIPGHFSFEIIDNVSFASSIPESSTLILTCAGS